VQVVGAVVGDPVTGAGEDGRQPIPAGQRVQQALLGCRQAPRREDHHVGVRRETVGDRGGGGVQDLRCGDPPRNRLAVGAVDRRHLAATGADVGEPFHPVVGAGLGVVQLGDQSLQEGGRARVVGGRCERPARAPDSGADGQRPGGRRQRCDAAQGQVASREAVGELAAYRHARDAARHDHVDRRERVALLRPADELRERRRRSRTEAGHDQPRHIPHARYVRPGRRLRPRRLDRCRGRLPRCRPGPPRRRRRRPTTSGA